MINKCLGVAFLCFLISLPIYSQNEKRESLNDNNSSLKETQEVRATSTEISNLNERIEKLEEQDSIVINNLKVENEITKKPEEQNYYKLLYENQTQANQKIISMTWWVIRMASLFLLAILGSQFLFNYRINKNEVKNIKADLDKKISELEKEMILRADEKYEKVKNEISSFKSETAKEFKTSIKHDFEAYDKMINIDDKIFKDEIYTDIKKLKSNIEKNVGDIWALKGFESDALLGYINAALLQFELKQDAKPTLENIKLTLENDKCLITPHNYGKLKDLINEIPESYFDIKQSISETFENKSIYKDFKHLK